MRPRHARADACRRARPGAADGRDARRRTLLAWGLRYYSISHRIRTRNRLWDRHCVQIGIPINPVIVECTCPGQLNVSVFISTVVWVPTRVVPDRPRQPCRCTRPVPRWCTSICAWVSENADRLALLCAMGRGGVDGEQGVYVGTRLCRGPGVGRAWPLHGSHRTRSMRAHSWVVGSPTQCWRGRSIARSLPVLVPYY